MPHWTLNHTIGARGIGVTTYASNGSDDYPSTIDQWSWLDYKRVFDDRRNPISRCPWLTARDRRRLTAYTVLAAYDTNDATAVTPLADDDVTRERREYGDASLLLNQMLAYLCGSDQSISVDGADADGEAEADENAAAQQATLRQWAADTNWRMKFLDGERNTALFGDGVTLLTWDPVADRPTTTVVDPAFYFPVLPDSVDDDYFPTKVYLAWEMPGDQFPDGKTRLRRITYELGPIEPGEHPGLSPKARERVNPDGTVSRWLPWTDPAQPTTTTCYLSDELIPVSAVAAGLNTDGIAAMIGGTYLSDDAGNLLNRLDLGIDFLPIIHQPNYSSGSAHFGKSSLAFVLQLVDDLQQADTNSVLASATTGAPIIALAQATDNTASVDGRPVYEFRPGAVWPVGPDGSMTVLNTADQLAELRNYVSGLQERLSRNARVSELALGGVDLTSPPSGTAISMMFAPMLAMIGQMKAPRQPKWALLLKFIGRMLMLSDRYQMPDTLAPCQVNIQSAIPNDQDSTVANIVALRGAKVISRGTAMRMAQEAGVPIDDIDAELAAVQAEDTDTANGIVDATGDPDDARRYLGIQTTGQTAQQVAAQQAAQD